MQQPLEQYRYKIFRAYIIIFYVLMAYKWLHGMWLYQMNPYFFYIKEDVFSWFIVQTGIHKFLLQNIQDCLLLDIVYFTAPICFWLIYKRYTKLTSLAALYILCINWLYVQLYALYPTISIEAMVGWLLFPIIFIPKSINTFVLLLNGLRYFFLFFFVSAAGWKFFQGGIFNVQQMSNILLQQHAELLYTTPAHWYAKCITWLIKHYNISYCLYLLATIVELSFIIGFFTKKFDYFLIALFILFLLLDHFIMRIPYYEICVLLITLWFSKIVLPVTKKL